MILEKVIGLFSKHVWRNFIQKRKNVKSEKELSKLCENTVENYYMIILKVFKESFKKAEKKVFTGFEPLNLVINFRISEDILNRQAKFFTNYNDITIEEFIELQDVILSIGISNDYREKSLVEVSWQNFLNYKDSKRLTLSFTPDSFQNPAATEQIVLMLNEIEQQK